MEGQGRIWMLLLVRNCVVCCMRSGFVVFKYSAIQCLMPKMLQKKECAFLIFEQYMFINLAASWPKLFLSRTLIRNRQAAFLPGNLADTVYTLILQVKKCHR